LQLSNANVGADFRCARTRRSPNFARGSWRSAECSCRASVLRLAEADDVGLSHQKPLDSSADGRDERRASVNIGIAALAPIAPVEFLAPRARGGKTLAAKGTARSRGSMIG
jgi:hypothetical protein